MIIFDCIILFLLLHFRVVRLGLLLEVGLQRVDLALVLLLHALQLRVDLGLQFGRQLAGLLGEGLLHLFLLLLRLGLSLLDGLADLRLGLDELARALLVLVVLVLAFLGLFLLVVVVLVIAVIIVIVVLRSPLGLLLAEHFFGLVLDRPLDQLFLRLFFLGLGLGFRLLFLGLLLCLLFRFLLGFGLLLGDAGSLSLLVLDQLLTLRDYSLQLRDVGIRRNREMGAVGLSRILLLACGCRRLDGFGSLSNLDDLLDRRSGMSSFLNGFDRWLRRRDGLDDFDRVLNGLRNHDRLGRNRSSNLRDRRLGGRSHWLRHSSLGLLLLESRDSGGDVLLTGLGLLCSDLSSQTDGIRSRCCRWGQYLNRRRGHECGNSR